MLLAGKKAMIFGVLNERSIGYAIAKTFRAQGAEIALSYHADPVRKRIEPICDELGCELLVQCNVASDADITAAADSVARHWGELDVLVHSVAYAHREDLSGRFVDTSREGFAVALDISAYSLVAMCRAFEELFTQDASVMAMSYYGSGKVVANYNAMGVAKAALEACVRYLAVDMGARGVRVNCLSPGPIKTMAASGIAGFRTILNTIEAKAPLRRNITQDDVGRAALFLASELSRNITGETIFVDAGYNIIGV